MIDIKYHIKLKFLILRDIIVFDMHLKKILDIRLFIKK